MVCLISRESYDHHKMSNSRSAFFFGLSRVYVCLKDTECAFQMRILRGMQDRAVGNMCHFEFELEPYECTKRRSPTLLLDPEDNRHPTARGGQEHEAGVVGTCAHVAQRDLLA